MSLPAGVSVGEGERLFVTQRGYFTPPFRSCMFAALCSILSWMGYRLPLARKEDQTPPENFVLALHEASGAPLTRATSIRESRVALRALLPDAEVRSGRLTDEEFLEELRREAAIRVIATMRDLPGYLQNWAGGGNVGHAFCVTGLRLCDGGAGRHEDHRRVLEVFWMDPMGRPSAGYAGDWVPWQDVRPHLRRRDGQIVVTLGYRDSALRETPMPSPRGPTDVVDTVAAGSGLAQGRTVAAIVDQLGFRARVTDRTPVLHPQTREQVTRIAPTDRARCLGRTRDGQFTGILVNTARLEGPNPKLLLIATASVQRI
ncbi:MAG TPA: hypothetical protein VMP67_09180 [Candidatus Limnocylindria bacterium]|nr:hypothetical protein [Candidatus Limnocylindria bacterium]